MVLGLSDGVLRNGYVGIPGEFGYHVNVNVTPTNVVVRRLDGDSTQGVAFNESHHNNDV